MTEGKMFAEKTPWPEGAGLVGGQEHVARMQL